jgi:hypothetical protein
MDNDLPQVTLAERIEKAGPEELRKIANGLRMDDMSVVGPQTPNPEAREPKPPGPGDGGTSTAPPPSDNIERENDPRRVRELAAKIAAERRRR